MSRNEIYIEAPPEAVFDVLADGARYDDWVVGAKEIRAVDDSFPAVGSRLHHSTGAGPAAVHDDTVVVSVEVPKHLELEAHARKMAARITFHVEREGQGTRVVMEEEIVGHPSGAVGWIAHRLILVRNAETLWRLKEQIESGPVSSGEPGDEPPRPPDGSRASVRRAAVPRSVADVTARVFGALTVLRGARGLHPRGAALAGVVDLEGPAAALASTERARAIVRFSRGAGLPDPLPDVNGVSIKILDAHGEGRHQDVLLASAGGGPLRRLLVPAVRFDGHTFSSILSYEVDGDVTTFGARVTGGPVTLSSLRAGAWSEMAMELLLWRDGGWQLAGRFRPERLVDDDVRFSPWNTGDRVTPLGWLNRLRLPAYAASQSAHLA